MNKTNVSILEYPQLRMDSVGYVRLGKFWNSVILGGHYWRLYYNDDYGAGVYVGRRKVELKPDRIYLLPPNCDLETWCTGEPVQLYLHFEMTQLAGNPDYLCNELRISDDMKILISRLRPMLEFKEDNNRANVKLFAIALDANAMAMLPQEALSELNSDKRIASICDYLRENMRNDISIDQLAARVRMASNAFLRQFREITGSTPYQYLLQLRYSYASQLLESRAFSIDEICELIGVKDRFHFSRRFKKLYGAAPAQYRRRHTPQG